VRRDFQEKIEAYKAAGKPIIYIDESGFANDMPRIHGYAPRGQRCFGNQDWHARGRTNVIGALLNRCLITLGMFDENVNADVFTAWVEQDLLPKLLEPTVIVMDNATFHKRKDTQDIIRKAGHTLLFMPPYSPDLNPIEKKWAQAKSIRRKFRCDTQTLFSAYAF
jgi:transposase